ncbi:unnamed protein product [Leuciscus chuanchicus]
MTQILQCLSSSNDDVDKSLRSKLQSLDGSENVIVRKSCEPVRMRRSSAASVFPHLNLRGVTHSGHHFRMDQVMQFVEPSRQFVKDSIRLVKRCTKPDRKGMSEFQKIAMATAIGFAIMGFIGFFVKLIHIPINNIIV